MKKFSKLYKRLLSEMSDVAITPEVHPYETIKTYWELHKKNAEFIEDRIIDGKTKVGLWMYHPNNSDFVSFYFFRDSTYPVACINGDISTNGGFHIKETLKVGGAAGFFMSDIIKNFLLEEFEYVLSDRTHTARGFQVYEFLVNDPGIYFQIYDNDDKSLKEIKSIDELREYYGHDKGNYQFRVELKK